MSFHVLLKQNISLIFHFQCSTFNFLPSGVLFYVKPYSSTLCALKPNGRAGVISRRFAQILYFIFGRSKPLPYNRQCLAVGTADLFFKKGNKKLLAINYLPAIVPNASFTSPKNQGRKSKIAKNASVNITIETIIDIHVEPFLRNFVVAVISSSSGI